MTELFLQPIGRLAGSTNLNLVIGLPLRNKEAFDQLLQKIYDPSSPHYHHYLTPQQIAESFGPTEEDYQAVIAWVRTNGLVVTGTHSDRTLVDVTGAVADIEKALHVTMRVYPHPTEARIFYAADVEPSIDLSVLLLHISGLNNFIIPHPGGAKGTPSGKATGTTSGSGSGPGTAYWGTDYRAAYAPGVTLTGSGQAVGLLELDGYYTNDVTAYETQTRLPNVTITNVLVDGATGIPDGNGNSVGEVSLDIEMAISMAPGLSKVIVYESPNCCYYWVDILKRMQEDNTSKQLSCSWLFDYDDPNAEPIYQSFAMQGQSFFQCSGDYLAFYNGVPQWTDDANVTLVGGTILSTTTTNGPWASETTWVNGDGVIGSGGGISTSYLGNVSIPTWQQGINMTANHGSTTMRNVPDVAMLAYDAWVIWDNGDSGWWWGTSIATPLWAGFTALINQQAALSGQSTVGFINPAVYAIGNGPAYGSCFHDITTGNNINSHSSGLFSAVSGYDLCTGWGSPTGSNLINALVAPTVAIAVQANPSIGGLVSGGGRYNLETNATVCASANASCYSFANWTLIGTVVSTSACYTFTAVSNATLVANFTPLAYYTITTSSSPIGGGSTSGGSTVPCGSNLTVCATPNACYSFVNWTDQNSNVLSTLACYSFIPTSNETLVANFTSVFSYTINTGSSPADGGTTSGGGAVTCGSNVTVCASANPCYSFVNWTVNSNVVSISPCYNFTPNGNANLVANFVAVSSYTINTSRSPASGGATSGGGTVACGSNLTVCATPNACYSFVNWTDQNSNVVSTSACYTFMVASNETLVANFTPTSFGNSTGDSLTNLWSFTGGSDGGSPLAGLVQGSDGNFYGTTAYDGAKGDGTVFRISPTGRLMNLWTFTNGVDGAYPYAGLVQGSDGNFYGTTSGSSYGPGGNGTVFRISPAGSLTTLWVFTGGSDGADPNAGLVQGSDGNFYGTAQEGRTGNGTVFRISPAGGLTNLWVFTGGSDGGGPNALVQGSDGNFYGTTTGGGTNGNGVVFSISPTGSLTTLWAFTNGVDGANPYAGLVQGGDGNFYGTTYGSGSGPSANGTVFRISPTGGLTNLWEFTGCDGINPNAELVQGSDGNFYGTTSEGAAIGGGTVFRITPNGSLTTLWMFTEGLDGAFSYAPVVQGIDGNFYGTTSGSGSGPSANGNVFRLSVPLNPPANQISAIQLEGRNVIITIPSVAGETYQLQYSDSLTLSNWSNVGGASMTNSIGSLLTVTNFGGAFQPQGFYRFAITP